MNCYTITDREFDLIRGIVYDGSGINLTGSKKQLVIGRLGKRLRTLGLSTFMEYYRYVKESGGEQELMLLFDQISTNKTDFFREPTQFDFLKKELMPRLMNGNAEKSIRIWSAACSTGEEPYSIAMTLREAVSDPDSIDIKILASDISTKVLELAGRGIYPADKLKAIPYPVMQRHFLIGTGEKAGFFKVRKLLRDMVVYRRINLIDSTYPIRTTFDVIFFRNAMIYFDRPTQSEVISRLSRYLKNDGYLFLGHSETLQGVEGFHYVRPNIYRKM